MYLLWVTLETRKEREVKNPRKTSEWTNKEIQEDSAGYLAAQKAEREDREAEARDRAETVAREDFEAAYVRAGGDPEQAEYAYKAHRGGQAAVAATNADEQAGRVLRLETLRRV